MTHSPIPFFPDLHPSPANLEFAHENPEAEFPFASEFKTYPAVADAAATTQAILNELYHSDRTAFLKNSSRNDLKMLALELGPEDCQSLYHIGVFMTKTFKKETKV